MILPPVTPEYDTGSQATMHEELTKADAQNFKLDQDNFLTTGSICLQNGDGDWFKLGIGLGAVGTVGTIVDGSDTGPGVYTNVSLTGGSGSGAKATVTTVTDDVQTVTITTGGYDYTISDVLSVPASIIGGSGATCVVATLAPILTITKLTGTQIDADGRPAIASTNPYS
jgi:hypothetical protein